MFWSEAMDREEAIELAIELAVLVASLRGKVVDCDAEVEHFAGCLEAANANMAKAKASLDEAVGELLGMDNGSGRRERHAEFAPERVSGVNREWRWRRLLDMTGADDVMEFFYRSPLYASLAKELGMGAMDTYAPKSGKTYRCVWLTEEEHGTILALTKERYPKG